ncbi:MAG: DUF3592 domain-containing protein [Deltaproteobacteria bacterium]|nr:DUF3592 domain-containing protein [Deltaproteobacteria bacterium]
MELTRIEPVPVEVVPPAPREPGPNARRLMFSVDAPYFAGLLGGAIFLLMGALFTFIFARGLAADFGILYGSREVEGVVTKAELDRSMRVNHRHPFVIDVRYRVDGIEHSASCSALIGPLLETRVGDRVPVEVSTLNPEWARVRGSDASLTGKWGGLILLFPAVGLFVVVGTLTTRKKRRRIYAECNAVPGIISAAGLNRRVRYNGRNPFKVEWTFELEGATYRGDLSVMDVNALAAFTPGTRVAVLVDPAKPRSSVLFVD